VKSVGLDAGRPQDPPHLLAAIAGRPSEITDPDTGLRVGHDGGRTGCHLHSDDVATKGLPWWHTPQIGGPEAALERLPGPLIAEELRPMGIEPHRDDVDAIPGPTGPVEVRTDRTDVVGAAITALQEFGGGLDRYQAASLINLWSRRDELTSADRAAVLNHFGRTG
jgi:hypothetical protein